MPIGVKQIIGENNVNGKTFLKIPLFKEVAKVKAGQTFGELALMANQPRSASGVCLTNCQFAILEKKDYQ